MSNQNINEVEKLISILLRETRSKNIEWYLRQVPHSLKEGTDDMFPIFLASEIQGEKFGLYIKRYKSYYDYLEYVWTEVSGLCILKNIHGTEFVSFQYEQDSPALKNLIDIARQQTLDITNIINKISGK